MNLRHIFVGLLRILFGLAFCLTPVLGEVGEQPDQQNTKNKAVSSVFKKATFAGGCFWCMEPPFEKLAGVKQVVSGYIGGKKENPNYQEVSAGVTGHAEAVEITYDPKVIGYENLLDVFWRNIDPTTANKQFVDEGTQYRSGIFFHSQDQRKSAEKSKMELEKSGRFGKGRVNLVTEIVEATKFYPAEEYHQDYYKKNPVRYKYYRHNSGRDKYLDSIWGKSREH